jgi:E3 ubiquitin-protein ligase FANCL
MAAAVALSGAASAASPSDDAAAAAALARSCPGADFPLLLPVDAALRAWSGFIAVRDAGGGTCEYALRLEGLPGLGGGAVDAAAPLARAALLPGAPLAALLGAALPALQRRLRCARRCADFLLELREAAASALAAAPPPPAQPPAFFAALAAQLGALPPGAVAAVAPDLAHATLRCVDASGRPHALRVAFPPGYPAHAPALSADMPLPPQLAWRPGASGLADVLAAAVAAAARHAWLWAALDALDARATVLDPELPCARAACHRRLSLGGAAALWVALDPQAQPHALPPPALRVYGPERGAAPRRAALAAALAAWAPPVAADVASGEWLLNWLQAALGEALPGRAGAPGGIGGAAADEAAPPECGICYAFACPGVPEGERGAPPGCACDNPRCGRAFHAPCLREWLRADGGAAGPGRAAFGTLFGACPYCGAPMAVAPDA